MRRLFAAAMILGMVWPAAGHAAPVGPDADLPPIPADQEVVFGPSTFVRGRGTPVAVPSGFPAYAGGDYTLLVEDLGPTGVLAEVWLNGQLLVTERHLSGSGRATITMAVTLLEENELVVLLAGKPGSAVRVTIHGAKRSAAWQEPCDARTELFTTSPVSPDLLRAIVPLGALAPPARTLPIPHVSLSPTLDADGAPTEVPVYAPGRATLVAVERRAQGGEVDLSLHLQPCRDVRVALHSLGRISTELEATIDRLAERYCPDAGYCIDAAEIDVAAGTLLGYGGGPGRQLVGFGVEDGRTSLAFANPNRYAAATTPGVWLPTTPADVVERVLPNRLSATCGLDYFDAALGTALAAKLASPDGTRHRTAPPVCGEHMQDAPGSAQGNWFAGAADNALADESTASALVHDNIDPGRGVFSIGAALPWGPDTYVFTPTLAGYVNTDFDFVAPGAVYCYQGLRGANGSLGGSVLLEVFSEAPGVANRLRIEQRWGKSCTSFPWSFSTSARVLQR